MVNAFFRESRNQPRRRYNGLVERRAKADLGELGRAVGWVTVSRGIPFPTPASEPCMRVSHSHGSLPHEPFVIQALSWDALASTELDTRALRVGLASGFRYADAFALKLGLILLRCPLVQQPHVSVSDGFPVGLGFLGYPPPSGHAAWSPPPVQHRAETALRSSGLRESPDGLLRSLCPFFATVGRYSTPSPTYRVETPYALTTEPNGDKFPFGPAWSAVILAGSNSRRLRTFVEYSVPGCLLGAVAALG
jgi:hypothetical protein